MNHNLLNSFSSRKKIFITGIAGFIGFHLSQKLKKQGHDVVGCDNFNNYYDPKLKEARAKILCDLGIPVHRIDIRDASSLGNLFLSESFTHIVHLAAQAGVRYCITHPEAYVESNLDGFVKILELARKFGSIPFIYASSSSVYGTNTKIPFSEDDITDSPSNFYGATKKSNELIARSYHHLYQIPVTGLRFFTVYGPWGRPDMAYFRFADALFSNKPIPLFAEGLMQRDFTYIDDIVEGTIGAIELSAHNEIFNLGNHQPRYVKDLIYELEIASGKKVKIEHYPMQNGEVPITYADITKSRHSLGFNPKTSLKNGILEFINWYQSYYQT